MKALKNAMFAVVGVALAMAMNAVPVTDGFRNPYFCGFDAHWPRNWPAKSAELVAKPMPQQRQQTTIDVSTRQCH